MAFSRCFKGFDGFRFIFWYRIVGFLTIAVSLCLLYNYYQSFGTTLRDFVPISTSRTHNVIKANVLTAKDAIKLFEKSNGHFLAATMTNHDRLSTGTSACVVDPAITDCSNMGLAAFLLETLDHIMLCSVLGSKNPVVFWRACHSVCSRNPRVNSWEWYFEPVNSGLEGQAERVLCPLYGGDILQIIPDVKRILNNSFKNRTGVEGFRQSVIITTQERFRINKLIQQYVKPNSRITEKVRKFYHRHLAGYNVLGVHVRGTDHWIETREQRLPPLMSWVKSAKTIFETLPRPRKIFIASDNDEVIIKFVTFFGKGKVS